MPVTLDRENRGKVNAVRRVPAAASDKGNICMHEQTGHLYTRRWESSSLQDFFNICSDITYVSNATELTTLLLDDTPRILTLGAKDYVMPSGPLTITAPKIVIGKSPEDSIMKFTWDPGRSTCDLYLNHSDIHFCNLSIMRTQDSTPTAFINFYEADNSGLHNCRIGYGSTDPKELISLYNSDYVTIEDCFLDIDSTIMTGRRLIDGSQSDDLRITRCFGEQQIIREAIRLDSCDNLILERCEFSNDIAGSVDSNPGVSLLSCAHVEVRNLHVRVNSFSGLTSCNALRTASSSSDYCNNVRIHDCEFTLPQNDDYTPSGESLVSLWGNYISFTDCYLHAALMGSNEDPQEFAARPVIAMRGNAVSLRGNDIHADECRCAVLVDANHADLTGSNSFGTRIVDNYIFGFGLDSSDSNPTGSDRMDGYGIVLTDTESVAGVGSALPCGYGTITGNTIAGDSSLYSTAITGCPYNYWKSSVSALYWTIGNNLIYCDPPSGAQVFGIKTLNIGYSSMLGNIGTNSGVKVVIDDSVGANNANEYGTTNDTESTGANI